MRVAYYYHRNEGATSGVFKKIVTQVNHWSRMGVTVALFNLSTQATAAEWRAALDGEVYFEQAVFSQGSIQRFKSIAGLANHILNWRPDLVYQRYGVYYPVYERVFAQVPVVFEVNSDDINEFRLQSKRRYWYLRLTRARMLQKAAGLVFVSQEISQKPHFARFQKPMAMIPNGIDLQQFPLLPPPNNKQPQLVFMGNAQHSWNGLEQIMWLAQQCPEWCFDLIGTAAADFAEPLPDNVIARGELTRSKYQPIMEKADIAVGTLALHRKRLAETSAIKVTEYLAYGIPTIIGYRDTNFPTGAEFILELPNTPGNVEHNLPQIKQFVESWRGKRVPRQQIAHIDSAEKEKQRLAFFEQILSVWPDVFRQSAAKRVAGR